MLFLLSANNDQKFFQQQVANDWDSVIKCYSSNLSVIGFLKETGG